MAKLMRRVVLSVAALALLASAIFAWRGGYVYVKASLAQHLIAHAWSRSQPDSQHSKPWPWADTAPVARMSLPSRSVQRFVLAGAHGQALAFGPGHLAGSAGIGESGNVVIAGHRDTHFRFLRDVEPGDVIDLESPSGITVSYEVRKTYVTDEMDMRPLYDTVGNRLTLITCYPFDAMVPGGPLRFVVVAEQLVFEQGTVQRRTASRATSAATYVLAGAADGDDRRELDAGTAARALPPKDG